jgi:hypothetical protein
MGVCGMRFTAFGAAITTIAALAALAAPSALAAASPKGTPCVAAPGPVVVKGSLYVPPGAVCNLAGTQVLGSVYVDVTAQLYAEAATIADDLDCYGSRCTLVRSTVGKNAILERGLGILDLYGSDVGGDVKCAGDTCNLYGDGVAAFAMGSVGRHVRAERGSSVFVQLTRVGQNISCDQCNNLIVDGSTVGGKVDANRAVAGATVCDSHVFGSVQVTGSRAALIGGCTDGITTIDGSVQLIQMQGEVGVVNATIGANLQVLQLAGGAALGNNRVANNIELVNVTGLVELAANAAGNWIMCKNVTPPPVAGLNVARKIDPSCGPIAGPPPL